MGPGFESPMVHQNGPLVKRLRHRPLTPVTPVRFWYGSLNIVGAYGNEVTPVPIPNTEVKLIHVDDTWLVTARETKSVPTFIFLLSSVGRASVRDYTNHREDKRANIND